MNRKLIEFDNVTDGIEWVATFSLEEQEVDDSFEDLEPYEIQYFAKDFDTAYKYAQQYVRKMKSEEDTSEEWANAEILSIVQY